MGSDSEAERTQQKEEKKKILALAPIAKPLAGKKLCKRTLKLVRRGENIFSFVFAFSFTLLLIWAWVHFNILSFMLYFRWSNEDNLVILNLFLSRLCVLDNFWRMCFELCIWLSSAWKFFFVETLNTKSVLILCFRHLKSIFEQSKFFFSVLKGLVKSIEVSRVSWE